MAKKIKISRKAMKQPDEFIGFTDKIIEYVEKNTLRVVGIAAAIVGVFFVVQLVGYYFESGARESNEQLAKSFDVLRTPLRSELTDEQIMANEKSYNSKLERSEAAVRYLEELTKEHPASEAAQNGIYYLAKSYYEANQFGKAIEIYEKVLKSKLGQDPAMKAAAHFSIASSHYNLNNFQKALDGFIKVADDKTTHNRKYALLNIARCYEKMGNFDKAVESYEKAEKEYPSLVVEAGVTLKVAKLIEAKNAPVVEDTDEPAYDIGEFPEDLEDDKEGEEPEAEEGNEE